MLRIKLVKSIFGQIPRTRATVNALGLHKVNNVVEHDDSPEIRGMIHHVKHLLDVQVVDGEPNKKSTVKHAKAARARKKGGETPAPVAKKAAKAETPKAEKPKAEKPKAEPKAKAPKAEAEVAPKAKAPRAKKETKA